jgi:ABC-type Fe3+/spermidine/putrescine transport system ATPase subunit
MSGRENVYVNGMLLGLTQQEIESRFDEIVAFSEIEEFIDTPVKFYSTGMFMRLGFSVAAHVNPDVLLVDEVLAVGDFAFQAKCLDRMRDLQSNGTTILMVSHAMAAIRYLCPRAVLIRGGRVAFDGPAEETLALHHKLMTADYAEEIGGVAVKILERELLGTEGNSHNPRVGELVTYKARLRFEMPVVSPRIHFQVFTERGTRAYGIVSATQKHDKTTFQPGDEVGVEIPFRVQLISGTYRLELTVLDDPGREILAHDAHGLLIYVSGRLGSSGVADLSGSIKLGGRDLTDHASLLIDGRPRTIDHARSPQLTTDA